MVRGCSGAMRIRIARKALTHFKNLEACSPRKLVNSQMTECSRCIRLTSHLSPLTSPIPPPPSPLLPRPSRVLVDIVASNQLHWNENEVFLGLLTLHDSVADLDRFLRHGVWILSGGRIEESLPAP